MGVQPEPLKPPAKFITEVKQEVKSQVLSAANQNIFEHVRTLIQQGKFLELCKLEQTEATWNSSTRHSSSNSMICKSL